MRVLSDTLPSPNASHSRKASATVYRSGPTAKPSS